VIAKARALNDKGELFNTVELDEAAEPAPDFDSGSGGEDSNDEPDALSENEKRKTP